MGIKYVTDQGDEDFQVANKKEKNKYKLSHRINSLYKIYIFGVIKW